MSRLIRRLVLVLFFPLENSKKIVFSFFDFYLVWAVLRPATSFDEFRGEWALVTGASRGLGRGYAIALVRRGINVILVARTTDTLE